jgi:hypothetical protein
VVDGEPGEVLHGLHQHRAAHLAGTAIQLGAGDALPGEVLLGLPHAATVRRVDLVGAAVAGDRHERVARDGKRHRRPARVAGHVQQHDRVGVQLPLIRAGVHRVQQGLGEWVAGGVGAGVQTDEQRVERLTGDDRLLRCDGIARDQRGLHAMLQRPGQSGDHQRTG